MARRGSKSKGGRPTLLTQAVHEKIIQYVRAGNFPESAAAAAGVSRPTLKDWMRDGAVAARALAAGEKLSKRAKALKAFSDDMCRALGEAETYDVMMIGKHAEKDWRAAAWRLERRNKQWAPHSTVDIAAVTTSVDGAPGTTAADFVRQRLERLRKMLAEAEGKAGTAPGTAGTGTAVADAVSPDASVTRPKR